MVLEKDIKVGSGGNLNIKFEGGKAKLTFSDQHASGTVSLAVEEDAKYFLEELKSVIPGTIDDLLIDMIEKTMP